MQHRAQHLAARVLISESPTPTFNGAVTVDCVETLLKRTADLTMVLVAEAGAVVDLLIPLSMLEAKADQESDLHTLRLCALVR